MILTLSTPHPQPRSGLVRWFTAACLAGLATLASVSAHAETGIPWIDSRTNLTIYGDLRVRYEYDWDSQNDAGVDRNDRNRGRIRARLGAGYQFDDQWSIGARVRTGDTASQQSPHLTFATDDGQPDDLEFVADRYFVQFKHRSGYIWGGRNNLPFWYQNELFWDEDVTPTGLGGAYDWKISDGKLTAAAGAFYLPDGGYSLNGQMAGAQAKWTGPIKVGQLTAAAGLNYIFGDEDALYLRQRNGERDYMIGVGSVQWVYSPGKLPLTFGADVFYNFLNYDAGDVAPFPAKSEDEVLGYVFSVQLGQLKKRNDWLVGYYYSHIERFAVNASYAQDDWIRFGNGAQTDASDFEGHEFRAAYALSAKINVVARLYLVEAITTVQDGNRFRLDLNWRF
ncbi:MAG: putative porin [Verrucomicrobiales bacterium]|nr:putative porin [Verrucomicrobiales bacterium]